MELQHALRLQHPQLQSHGMNHPPSEQNQMIAQLIGYLQMAGFGLLFAGSYLFQMLKIPEPELVQWMSNNKMNSFCLVFMMGMVSTQLMATGAFEVYYNGNCIFSKLEEGRMPHVQELVRALEMYGVRAQQAKY